MNKEKYNEIKLLMLNLSQDIRFAANFKMKNHGTLERHLLIAHEDLIKIRDILKEDNE